MAREFLGSLILENEVIKYFYAELSGYSQTENHQLQKIKMCRCLLTYYCKYTSLQVICCPNLKDCHMHKVLPKNEFVTNKNVNRNQFQNDSVYGKPIGGMNAATLLCHCNSSSGILHNVAVPLSVKTWKLSRTCQMGICDRDVR